MTLTGTATAIAGATAIVFSAVGAAPVAATPPPTSSVLTSIDQMLQAPAATTSKKATKAVLVTASARSVTEGSSVTLHASVSPAKAQKVTFQQRKGGAWSTITAKQTSKKGHAKTTWVPATDGTFSVRATAKSVKSKPVAVVVDTPPSPTPPAPTPPPTPPAPSPESAAVTWPTGNPLEVDRSYPVTVTVTPQPTNAAQVSIQRQVAGGWQDLAGGTGTTDSKGAATLVLNQPLAGIGTYRVAIAGSPVTSTEQQLTFSDAGDALYNVPLQLPADPGVIVKAQEFPMTYPKLPIKNPLKPTEDLIVPQIGDPAAGPPTCMTDPAIPRSECKIPGKQYRVMYSDKRWVPNSTGGGKVADGTVAATALVMVPDNVAADAPVVAWAHPTLGQAKQCSISRGVDPIPMGDGTMGPGGMDINLLDVSFFLNQMLAKGYVVVMPDYLGIATNGPTGDQKTYVVGPQEARDLFYAVKSLQTPANPTTGWPGVTAGKHFVAVGHSQGGHAAMWAGIEAATLEPQTGLQLKGVTAIAPATDMNQIVTTQWGSQVNWVLGPEVIQTYLGYLPEFAMKNNVLTPAGMQNLEEFTTLCTTQALVASTPFYPDGMEKPGTPFMQDPADPKFQQAYLNWGKVFSAMTPSITPGQPNSYPTDLPLTLISGTADNIVISQVNAAMQESFCSGGAALRTFWTPVATGVANPPTATEPSAAQAGNHLNVLNFPFANDISPSGDSQAQVAAGAMLEATYGAFGGTVPATNCAQRQATHQAKAPVGKVPSWYVFPRVDWASGGFDPSRAEFYETGGSALLPKPTAANPAPALGTVDMKTYAQTGCGYQFKKKAGIVPSYESNPACVQWGLWPYGTFSYPDAKAGQTWGTYPLQVAAVKATATSQNSVLKVDVNPNSSSKNYKVTVQRKSGKSWVKHKKLRTQGTKDVVSANLKAGTYRVHMPAQHGQKAYKSAKVTLRK